MLYPSVIKVSASIFLLLLLAGCGGNEEPSQLNNPETGKTDTQSVTEAEGVIARVGSETITYDELSAILNSSAMAGLAIPAPGTSMRKQVMITMLNNLISANLVYLDAKDKGVDLQTSYTEDVKRFEDSVLATIYSSRVLIGEIPVSQEEVVEFYNSSVNPKSGLDENTKLAIETIIRKIRFAEHKDTIREKLREGIEINVHDDVLSHNADADRSETDVVATIAGKPVKWNDVKVYMRGTDKQDAQAEIYVDSDDERLKRLQDYIDNTLMVEKAIAAGMKDDPAFIKRSTEFRKTMLVSLHRNSLLQKWKPTDVELKNYFEENRGKISIPEARKLQMVVVASKAEAENIKTDIDSGKITMFQAAQQYSHVPNAKITLGEMGWVSRGASFEELNDFIFSIQPEIVSGPVESKEGWNLVKVQEVKLAQYQSFDEPQVQQLALRFYMQNKFNDYVIDLRNSHFDVTLYDAELGKGFQKEADDLSELNKSKEKNLMIKQQAENNHRLIVLPPPPEQ